VLAGVKRHVDAAPGPIDHAAYAGPERRQRAIEHVVYDPSFVELYVEHRSPVDRPAVGHLPAGLGVEDRSVEHEARARAVARMREDGGLELVEEGVVMVRADRSRHGRGLPRPRPAVRWRRPEDRETVEVVAHVRRPTPASSLERGR
jgi:hypothetical protein